MFSLGEAVVLKVPVRRADSVPQIPWRPENPQRPQETARHLRKRFLLHALFEETVYAVHLASLDWYLEFLQSHPYPALARIVLVSPAGFVCFLAMLLLFH